MGDDGGAESAPQRETSVNDAGDGSDQPAVVLDGEERDHPPEAGESDKPPPEEKLLRHGNYECASKQPDGQKSRTCAVRGRDAAVSDDAEAAVELPVELFRRDPRREYGESGDRSRRGVGSANAESDRPVPLR